MAADDAAVVLDCFDDVAGLGKAYAANHAGGGAAHLQVVLAHWRPIKHRIEGSDLIHINFTHIQYLGNLVHSAQRDPVAVLLLGYVEQRNDSRALVVPRVLRHHSLDLAVVLLCEVEGRVGVVVGSVLVGGEGVGEGAAAHSPSEEQHHSHIPSAKGGSLCLLLALLV